jgi:hypothetical protein
MTTPQAPEGPNPYAPTAEPTPIPPQYSPQPWGNGSRGGSSASERHGAPPQQPQYWGPPQASWPPAGAGPDQSGYWYPPAPAQAAPTGLAVTALVLGIVAVVLSWVPFLGLVIGVLAVVFGAIAAARARKIATRPDRGKAIAGIVTGTIAVVASIGFVVLAMAVAYNSDEADGRCDTERAWTDPDC